MAVAIHVIRAQKGYSRTVVRYPGSPRYSMQQPRIRGTSSRSTTCASQIYSSTDCQGSPRHRTESSAMVSACPQGRSKTNICESMFLEGNSHTTSETRLATAAVLINLSSDGWLDSPRENTDSPSLQPISFAPSRSSFQPG